MPGSPPALLARARIETRIRALHQTPRRTGFHYRELAARRMKVRVGMEATGYSRWFERLLAELGIEVWIGDAAETPQFLYLQTRYIDRSGGNLRLSSTCSAS